MLAAPTAGRHTAPTTAVDAVDEAHAQDAFLRAIWDLRDAQRERVKVEQQTILTNQATAGHVGIAQHKVSPGVFGSVRPNQTQHLRPVLGLRIIAVHDFGLAEVDRFDACVEV